MSLAIPDRTPVRIRIPGIGWVAAAVLVALGSALTLMVGSGGGGGQSCLDELQACNRTNPHQDGTWEWARHRDGCKAAYDACIDERGESRPAEPGDDSPYNPL